MVQVAVGRRLTPANGTNAGYQANPVQKQDEDENRREKPECSPDQIPADDAFEEIAQAFDQPFPEILSARGNLLNIAGGNLGKADQQQGNRPGHDSRTGDRQFANMKYDRSRRRELLLMLSFVC